MMTSDEIRELFLSFFAERGHLRIPSASLVPAPEDTSTLTTIAGMQPLKPYFTGRERPPAARMVSCQKCFRTVDLDIVGTTARHLTFFEMLGNFSIGDYFKRGAVEFAWELAREGFGFPAERIWITVFEGDSALGLGPDEEAIEAWLAVGVPRERIIQLGRDDNFWQSGPTGPCGPDSELYLDRGVEYGGPDDLPGGENARFVEFWNLVFMQYEQDPPGTLTPLPGRNIDTGLGLNRMAMILQNAPTVFDTDQFRPLIELGETLSGRRYGSDDDVDRSLRVLADHARGMTFLVADGVVPSNTERGYVLRRVMRRAVLHGRSLGFAPGFLVRYGELVRELMGAAYPELDEHREQIDVWLAAEEEHFGHTLEQGLAVLRELIERAREDGGGELAGADAFRLHDTFGFPIELTKELVAEDGLAIDQAAFDELMAQQRRRSRQDEAAAGGADTLAGRDEASAFSGAAGFTTRFVGYETTEQATTVEALERVNGRVLLKLADSPFYAAGGGQISDVGVIECADGDCRARVAEVVRLGEDQAIYAVLEDGELRTGERVHARVDRLTRHATECNHTATHLLHAALRERLGGHVRQAGSYVGPDKLRFDFSHGQRDDGRAAARRRGPDQRLDPREPSGAADHDDARRGARARCDGAVRREVRRGRADGGDRRRRVLARAVRWHARALDRRDRRAADPRRDIECGKRAPHRGADRSRGGRGAALAQRRARADRRDAAHDGRRRRGGRRRARAGASRARKGSAANRARRERGRRVAG